MRAIAISLAVLCGAAGLVACAGSGSTTSTSFWVSPTGDDHASGSQRSPFATLDRARDAVRSTRAAHPDRDVRVELADGVLRLDHPFELTADDSGTPAHPVVYESAPGAHAVVSGAVRVPNDAWQPDPQRPGQWIAQVGDVATRNLYVDGTAAIRARTTSYPEGFRPQWNGGGAGSGIAFLPAATNPQGWRDPTTWQGLAGVEAVGDIWWKQDVVPVTGVTAPSGSQPGLLTMSPSAWNDANLFREAADPTKIVIWSMYAVDHFENSLSFLDEPREWYLDRSTGTLHYQPAPWEDMSRVDVELPVLDTLVRGSGTADAPLHDVIIRDLGFTGATWNAPSGPDGFIEDQAGFHIVGTACAPNPMGHCQDPEPLPGNVTFDHVQRLFVEHDTFTDLGATALRLGTGTQDSVVRANNFDQIGASAVALGGIASRDHHPSTDGDTTRDDVIDANHITDTGLSYSGSPAINVGFALRMRVTGNVIHDVSWGGISVGWGWGLLDPGGFPGVPGATQGMWGDWSTPTINRGGVISGNDISGYQQVLNDTGAVYTTGWQGSSATDALVIEHNIAHDRAPASFGNTYYTDGGTRWVSVRGNSSANNPLNVTHLAPAASPTNPLPIADSYTMLDGIPYGSDIGGCRTYGDITYTGNRWFQPPLPAQITAAAVEFALLGDAARVLSKGPVAVPKGWSDQGFFDICDYADATGSYPRNMTFVGNTTMPR